MPLVHRFPAFGSAKARPRYAVVLGDPAGEYDRIECETFAETLRAVEEQSRRWGREKVIVVANYDRCDEGTNGLTFEESEAVSEAIDRGRGVLWTCPECGEEGVNCRCPEDPADDAYDEHVAREMEGR